jgi:hypothetical protein
MKDSILKITYKLTQLDVMHIKKVSITSLLEHSDAQPIEIRFLLKSLKYHKCPIIIHKDRTFSSLKTKK